jgi:DNA-binding transcriptional MocR family regulator
MFASFPVVNCTDLKQVIVMTTWQPNRALLRRPVYLSLADQIARAVAEGHLPNGTRLPTHRDLANKLGLSVQTVSRAYDELTRRGLVAGEVGRGSFVRGSRAEPRLPYLPERLKEVIDLSILKPICEVRHVQHLKDSLARLAEDLPAAAALSFRPNPTYERHRAVGVGWLRLCGLETEPGNIILTNGATAGMTIALMSVAPQGATVVTEEVGHHTLGPLASYLGFRLRGVATDDEGVRPDALDEACRSGEVRALFVMPNPINARATLMGAARRRQIAALARRHDLMIVENDPTGPLFEERLPPLAALAPERTLYVTSFSKCVVPGLRAGYLVVPDRLVAGASNRHLVTNWMATALIAEIATRWVEDGLAAELVRWQRQALRGRQQIAAQLLKGIPCRAHPEGLHIWLPLPPGQTETAFVSHARLRGVAIAPGSAFCISSTPQPPAVRISVGSTTKEELRTGLGVVVSLLLSNPEPVLLVV